MVLVLDVDGVGLAGLDGVETTVVSDFCLSIQLRIARFSPILNPSSMRSASCRRQSWRMVTACSTIYVTVHYNINFFPFKQNTVH